MADIYRPPGHDRSRRGSSPGRQRDNESFPPGRPAAPLRSFSNMDPGRPNPAPGPRALDHRKRHASQSPSGAQARKQQKHDPQQNGATTQPQGSNKPPPPTSAIRKSSNAAVASSPRSPRDSVTSGRSTPQQRPSALAKETTAQLSNGNSTSSNESNLESQPLVDLLSKFSAEGACRADLEHEKKQAEARSLNAQHDYNEMKKHFAQFPSIKERLSAEKDTAHQALLAKERSLNEHTLSQTSTIGALASLLGQLATPKPSVDMVSRAEHDSLQKDLIAMKQEVATIRQLRNDLDGVKTTAEEAMSRGAKISTLHQKVDLMNRENVAVAEWKQSTDARLNGVENIDQRVKTIDQRSNATQKDLDSFKNQEASTFATRQQMNDIERKGEAFAQKIEALQRAQAKATADSLNLQVLAKSQRSLEEQNALKQELVDLQTLGSDLKTSFEEAATIRETMKRTINQLKADVVDCKDALSTVRDSIEEAGEEAIVKRVKRLDVLVNNLSSNVGDNSYASISRRLSQLESDSNAVREGIRSMKTSHPLPIVNKASSGATVNLTHLETRLKKVEDDFSTLEGHQDERDDELIKHVGSIEVSLKEQFSSCLTDQLSAARDHAQKIVSDSLEKMANGYQGLEKSVNDLQEAVRSKADITSVEALKAAMGSMSGEVKKLQAHHHQRAKSTSQTPTPTNAGPQVNGSHQLPNGVTGSPHGIQHGHGHGSTQHAPSPTQTQNMSDMQTQINGLVAVTQQLKMRCDNLQTDEVVRSMIDQFNAIYPNARNINGSLQSLGNGLNAAQKQLSALQQHQAPPSEQFDDDVKQATAKAEGASKTAHNVFQQVQKVWGEMNTIREAVAAIEQKALEHEAAKKPDATQKITSSDSSIREEVTAMRKDLDKTTEVANAADRLSRGHATRLSKVVPETLQTRITAVESKVQNLEEETEGHDQMLRKGELAFAGVQTLALDAKNMAVQVGKKYGTLNYRVKQLEGEDDD